MSRYEKPTVSVFPLYAEGVFSASGELSDFEPVSFVVRETNSWTGSRQYDITLTNNTSSDIDVARIEVPLRGAVSYVGGNWSMTELKSGSVVLTFDNWGKGIRANGSVTVYTQVMGDGDFSLG